MLDKKTEKVDTFDLEKSIDLPNLIKQRVKELTTYYAPGGDFQNAPFWKNRKWKKAWDEKEAERRRDSQINQVKESGTKKLLHMFDKMASMGYAIDRASGHSTGLVHFQGKRAGMDVSGYADPRGRVVVGLRPSRVIVLKINFIRKNCIPHDDFLEVILKDGHLRKENTSNIGFMAGTPKTKNKVLTAAKERVTEFYHHGILDPYGPESNKYKGRKRISRTEKMGFLLKGNGMKRWNQATDLAINAVIDFAKAEAKTIARAGRHLREKLNDESN